MEKIRHIRAVYFTPVLMVTTFSLSLIACGDVDQKGMDTQGHAEHNGPPCPEADWNHLPVVSLGAVIEVDVPTGVNVRTAMLDGIHNMPPERLSDSTLFQFDTAGVHTLFAMSDATDCSATITYAVVEVMSEFPTTDGVDKEDPRIQGWASSWSMPVQYGTAVDEMWQTPERAMGPASGSSTDIVSLGEGGQIEVFFDGALYNGEGADFAVFENSFAFNFLEVARVAVSSDGVHFAQFPMIYLGTEEIDSFGYHEPQLMHGLAGKYPGGVGTPFDLEELFYTQVKVELVKLLLPQQLLYALLKMA